MNFLSWIPLKSLPQRHTNSVVFLFRSPVSVVLLHRLLDSVEEETREGILVLTWIFTTQTNGLGVGVQPFGHG